MMNAAVEEEEEVPSGQSVPLKNTAGDAAAMRSTTGDVELLPQLMGAGPVKRSCNDDEDHPTDVCYNKDKEEKPHGASSSCCGSSTSVTSHDSPCSLGSVVEVKDLQEDVLLPCTWQDVDESPTVLTEGALAAAAARSSSVESDKARRGSLDPAAAAPASSSSFRQRLQVILYHKNQEIAARLQHEIVSRLRQRAEDPSFEEEKSEGGRLLPSSPRSPPLVLVSGALGSGKSYLARSIRTAVQDEVSGYVVTGRCCEGASGSGTTSDSDERKDGIINQSVPYPALVSALEEFASAVLRRGPHEVARIRDAVQTSLGIETFVLSRFMPSLREILGTRNDETSTSSLHATDSKESTRPNRPTLSCDSVLRFAYVFENFVRAISSPEHPVVMVLDDLHDCDPCSLCVLRSVLLSAQSNSNNLAGFLVVGTLQPDRVPCDSVLASTLRALEDVDRGIEIAHFPLLELDSSEIHEAVSTAVLGKTSADVQELADHIYRCTAGNPYHVSELVAYMEDCGYVTLSDGCWSWDKEGIAELRACAAASTMLDDLISRKLSRLSPECREALKVASCLGFYIDEELVGYALGYSVLHVLREGEASGLLSRDRWGLHAESRYRFANAAVRRAAKDLIPSESQASFQLEMARRIWKRCDEASAEKHLYTVIVLFEKGKCLIERPSERHAMASLCYHAGVMAARSSSFRVASEHFDLGLQVLGPNRWRENYELSLSLCNAASEMGMCTGNFASMEAHLSDVLTHARVYRDTIQARATKIYYYGTSAAYQADAVREGIEVLNELGIDVPPRASKIRLALELRRVRKNLKGRTDSAILRMPTLVNAEKRSCLQILSLVYQNAMFARPDLLPIVILRMIDITLQYGLSEFASLAFANYGALCVEVNGDVEMGYRYGSLGLAILDRFNANELVPRVYGTFYKHIHVHTKPVKDTLQPLAKAYRIGLYTGDLDAAFLCAIYFCVNCFDTGHPLPALEAEYSDIIRRMEASRQKSMLTTALPLAQCIRDLMGLSDDPLSASGDLIDHDELMKTSEEAGRPLVVSTMLACRLTLCNVLNEFEFVSGFLHEFVTKYLDLIPPGSTRTCMKMSVALCAIELARLGRHRRRNVRIAKSMIASLRKYADLNPHFCLDKLYLVQAELASYQCDWSRARQKYLSAVALSSANESLYSAAKSNECYARHLLRGAGTDDPEFARDSSKYFVEACRLYREWGAAAKVRRLQREVKELFPRLDFQVASKPAARPSLKSINLLEYSFLGFGRRRTSQTRPCSRRIDDTPPDALGEKEVVLQAPKQRQQARTSLSRVAMTPPPSITGPEPVEVTIIQAHESRPPNREEAEDHPVHHHDDGSDNDEILAFGGTVGRSVPLSSSSPESKTKPSFERSWRSTSTRSTVSTSVTDSRTQESTVSGASVGSRSDVASSSFQDAACTTPDCNQATSEIRRRLQKALYCRNVPLESKLEFEARRRLQDPYCDVKPFVVISGNPGSGKVRLARSIRPLVEQELGGYFVTGRFDQMHSPTPYPAFVGALEDLLDKVVHRGPTEVERIRRAILDVEGLEAPLLLRFLPCLKAILGDDHSRNMNSMTRNSSEAASTSPSSGAILRFMYMFGNVFRAVSSVECPVVLVVDSLHYCDTISSNIMATVLVHEQCPGLMVIGTLEADKVPADSMLAGRLQEIAMMPQGTDPECRDGGVATMPHIILTSPSESILRDALQRSFHSLDDGEFRRLSQVLHRHTDGDPLFVSELICYLCETQLLTLDPTSEFLDCDADEAEEALVSLPTLEALLCARISSLSVECREVLQVASCLGSILDPTLIEYALGRPVRDSIEEALARGGLLICSGVGTNQKCRFVNGSTQRAANLLIPEDGRQLYCLEMGRRIWRRLDESSSEEHFFQVLSLLRVGQEWIRRPKERQAVATLCLTAGIKAARSSAFLIANEHLSFGIQVLGVNRWREHYDLALSLHNAAAEVGVCTGNVEAIDLHLNSVLRNARQFQDTMQARVTKFYSSGMQAGRYHDAMAEGIYLLGNLGLKFPANCSKARLAWELLSVSRLLRGKSDQFFMRLPVLAEQQKRFCLQVLMVMYQYALFSRPDLVPLTILHMMKITIKYGSSEFTAAAIASYGILCLAAYNDVDTAYRYGKLAMALFDRDGTPEFLPRVHSMFYGHIYAHKRPITEVLRPLARAYRIGIHMGDIQGAFLCANLFCIQALESGARLDEVEVELDNLRNRLASSNQQSILSTLLPLAQTVREFIGRPNPIANLEELLVSAKQSGQLLDAISVLYCRLAIAWIFCDFSDDALMMDCICPKYYDSIPPGVSKMGILATVGVYAIGAARVGRNARRNIRVAKAMVERLRFYARHEPSNSLPRLHMLQAELASYHKQDSRAQQKYLSAIALSAATRCRAVWAKSNECYAHHLYRLSGNDAAMKQESMKYFMEAHRVYEDWGGTRKCQRLMAEVDELFPGERRPVIATPPPKRPSLLLHTTSGAEFASYRMAAAAPS